MKNQDFLGRGWSFPPTFSVAQKSVGMVVAEEDINQSLKILLSTSLGERVMQPEYGCNLRDFQFEALNMSMIGFIKKMVEDAILYHEARIRVKKITVSESDSSTAINGILDISIDYIIKGTNSRYNFVYPFYLNEGVQQS